MSDLIGHFLDPGHELDAIAREAAAGWGTAESLRARRREADRLIRGVELLRQRLDATGWPSPSEGASYFLPLPGQRWEQGKDAADQAAWQLAFRSAIGELIDLYRATVENCYDLGPGALPTGADEAMLHKRNEKSQRALEEYHAWLNDRAELGNRLHQFRNDMLSFPHHAPPAAAPNPAVEADAMAGGLVARKEELKDDGPRAGVPGQPRFSDWAFGMEYKGKWHVFKKHQADWMHRGVLSGLSAGRQARLMEALAQGGGFLEEHAVIAAEAPRCTAGELKKIKAKIQPELTRIRGTLRDAMDLRGSKADPLPYDNLRHGWVAAVEIGYATKDDGGRVGDGDRFNFTPSCDMPPSA